MFAALPDRTLVIADYSAIEMRIMAWLSRDPVLLEVFRTGADPHRCTAALTPFRLSCRYTGWARPVTGCCQSRYGRTKADRAFACFRYSKMAGRSLTRSAARADQRL